MSSSPLSGTEGLSFSWRVKDMGGYSKRWGSKLEVIATRSTSMGSGRSVEGQQEGQSILRSSERNTMATESVTTPSLDSMSRTASRTASTSSSPLTATEGVSESLNGTSTPSTAVEVSNEVDPVYSQSVGDVFSFPRRTFKLRMISSVKNRLSNLVSPQSVSPLASARTLSPDVQPVRRKFFQVHIFNRTDCNPSL